MAKTAKKHHATNKSTAQPLAGLQQLLEHQFAREDLLTLALTHRSYVFDGARPEGVDPGHPSQDNEQLEFMGDAVLGLIVAEELCRRFPASREGELTQMRAALVSRRNLGLVGIRLKLGRWLRLGPTTDEAGGRQNAALISNAVEAIIAALYLDGGLATARSFIEREILSDAVSLPDGSRAFNLAAKDHKTALQELVQAEGLGRVLYTSAGESGPAHNRIFRFTVSLEGSGAELGTLAEAESSTKKQAQQEAAEQAYRTLAARFPGASA